MLVKHKAGIIIKSNLFSLKMGECAHRTGLPISSQAESGDKSATVSGIIAKSMKTTNLPLLKLVKEHNSGTIKGLGT